MGAHIAKVCIKKLINNDKQIRNSKILVMGATFKENVSDIRNSKIVDIVKELESFSVQVEVVDPYASSKEVEEEYGFTLSEEIGSNYDGIVLAVAHDDYKGKSEEWFMNLTNSPAFLLDLKGIYRGAIQQLEYWSL